MKTKIKWGWFEPGPIRRDCKERVMEVKKNFEKYLVKQGKSGLLFFYLQGDLLAKVIFGSPSECLKHLDFEAEDDMAEDIALGKHDPVFIEDASTVVCLVFDFNIDCSVFEVLGKTKNARASSSGVGCLECGAQKGELHRFGCPAEICHQCGWKLRHCFCPYKRNLPSDDWQQTPEGAIPHQHIRIPV